jgi:hypothetical protein
LLNASVWSGEWEILFGGKGPNKLRGYQMERFPSENWVVEGDALKTVPGKAVDLITTEKYKDFELELEWKVAEGGNSGVMYNVVEGAGPSYTTGPEMQILDDARHPDGREPKTTAGALYGMLAPNAKKKLNPAGQWNKSKIVIKGDLVEHWLNGEKIVEYKWGSEEMKRWIANSKFKDMPEFAKAKEGGHITIQHHGEEAWFRNIRIRRL